MRAVSQLVWAPLKPKPINNISVGANYFVNTDTDRTYNSENYIKECKLGESFNQSTSSA